MHIKHPQSELELLQRDQLLQNTLRQPEDPFAIASEYPLILSPENRAFSYLGIVDGKIVTHANLWPRLLVAEDQTTCIKIGIVTNVATDPAWRKQGLSSQLLEVLSQKAREQELSALILWAYQVQFYQKLGFASWARERRLTINCEDAPRISPTSQFKRRLPHELSDEQLAQCLALRLNGFWTIRRSVAEFRELLMIPGTYFYEGLLRGKPCYAIYGRGADMRDVIHEWGCSTPECLVTMVRLIGRDLNQKNVLVLSPFQMPENWLRILIQLGFNSEIHPMAMLRNLSQDPHLPLMVQNSFIWGMDSV